ncbi:FAD-binding oxidoreductase [Phytoactinopolyspora alkaliphila]|uniref:FAD-binding oxidoreductase n=1 Tax=Phytoactinopolyspora alkaliphila TaxID=1783498 RepID=A0A6N9YJK3_9ACTN|nr:FAD-binding oxidoreductase [Phytoactinopolyspora alkaliphila]NED95173.1 FAD-binding oxidoreductase [Phytoactinopolyspora alkaliphila]
MTTVENTPTTPAATDMIGDLRDAVAGEVITPEDTRYDEARRVWNGVIDRHPAVIVRCINTDDVAAAVRIAGVYRPEISVRGGGHQVAGSAVCDDGLVIDLSLMNSVTVDPAACTARVEGGARWADVDRATQAHGLVTTGGEVSITGVAGLTLGGGMGQLQRAYGLACDNVISMEIVTADGELRDVSATENPDLFWAAKGAGRGLGVVTSFTFGLRPFGPDAAITQVIYPYEEAESVLRKWRDAVHSAPETVSPEAGLWSIPPDPSIPAELHGIKMCLAAALYAGDPADSAAALAPYSQLGTPMIDQSGIVPYVEVQSALDPMVPDGRRYYFKSHFMNELSDEAIATFIAFDQKRPTPLALTIIRTLGGAIDRVSPDESAYPHRGARFNFSIDCIWDDPADDERVVTWAREFFQAMRPFATGGVYMNFAGFEGENDVPREATHGRDARVEQVLRTYDPTGLFASAAARV